MVLGLSAASEARLLGSPQRPAARLGVVRDAPRSRSCSCAAGWSMVPVCADGIMPPGPDSRRPQRRSGRLAWTPTRWMHCGMKDDSFASNVLIAGISDFKVAAGSAMPTRAWSTVTTATCSATTATSTPSRPAGPGGIVTGTQPVGHCPTGWGPGSSLLPRARGQLVNTFENGAIFAGLSQVPIKGITPWFPRGLSLGAGRGTRTLDLQHGKLSL